MDKPRNIISLKGCIIDGIWSKDSSYTFTIRSLADDELFYYLVEIMKCFKISDFFIYYY